MTPPALAALLLAAAPVLAAPDSLDQGPPAFAASDAAPRWDPGCADFKFGPDDGSSLPAVELVSREWVEDCLPAGERGEACFERPGAVSFRFVTVSISDRRPLHPWERDVFRVCLQENLLQSSVVSAAYEYRLLRDGSDGGGVVFAPIRKIPLPPDPQGITGDLYAPATLALRDLWASDYAGENVVLRVELRKEVGFWPDKTIVRKELVLPSASTYFVDFLQYAAEFSMPMEPGKTYYAVYSFARQGTISTGDFITPRETSRVAFAAFASPTASF